MPCEHHKQALTEAAARDAELSAKLRQHLATCESCAVFFAKEQSLFASIDSGVFATANAEIPSHFLSHVRVRINEVAAPQRRWILAPTVLACGVAILLAFFVLRANRHTDQRNSTTPIERADNAQRHEARSMDSHLSKATTVKTPGVTRRHVAPLQVTKSSEPLVLVPSGQKEAVEVLLAGLRRGEIQGEELVKKENGAEQGLSPIPPIPPIGIPSLEIKPMSEGVSGSR